MNNEEKTVEIVTKDDLKFERNYWGDCCNTFDEEQKHYIYGRLMGLNLCGYSFDVGNKTVLDIGGGPVSMLLKCVNLKSGLVCDPIVYPEWTIDRYMMKKINVIHKRGEDIDCSGYDECWIYNCLQHTEDPVLVIKNAKKAAKTLRIFEWIDIPAHEGHPHCLTESFLNDAIGKTGKIIKLSQQGCFGSAYFGNFEF